MNQTKRIAFALGGLAGNNAHGAGFLEAALASGMEPVMISCTSGQIYWVYQYLRCRKAGKPGLKAILQEDIRKVETFHNPDLDTAALAIWGRKGVFRTAYAEYLSDAFQNALRLSTHAFTRNGRRFFLRSLLELFPCRMLMPDFSPAFLKAMSDELRNSDIGIVFNSYSPTDGHEYLHLNNKARELLSATSSHPERFQPGQPSSYRDRTTYQDITPEHILDGLWLYQYGFTADRKCVDGAYFRDIILSELACAEKIFIVRPLHFHWSGSLPRNYPEMEDLKTKLGFNGSYAGERYQILLMNKLLEGGALQGKTADGQPKYHHIEPVEIEMEMRRGFFDYLFEDMAVFDAAFLKAAKAFIGPVEKKVEPKAEKAVPKPVKSEKPAKAEQKAEKSAEAPPTPIRAESGKTRVEKPNSKPIGKPKEKDRRKSREPLEPVGKSR